MADVARATTHSDRDGRAALHEVGLPRGARASRGVAPAARRLALRRHPRGTPDRRHGRGRLRGPRAAQPAQPRERHRLGARRDGVAELRRARVGGRQPTLDERRPDARRPRSATAGSSSPTRPASASSSTSRSAPHTRTAPSTCRRSGTRTARSPTGERGAGRAARPGGREPALGRPRRRRCSRRRRTSPTSSGFEAPHPGGLRDRGDRAGCPALALLRASDAAGWLIVPDLLLRRHRSRPGSSACSRSTRSGTSPPPTPRLSFAQRARDRAAPRPEPGRARKPGRDRAGPACTGADRFCRGRSGTCGSRTRPRPMYAARRIKTPREIELLRAAAALADVAQERFSRRRAGTPVGGHSTSGATSSPRWSTGPAGC